MHDMDRRNFIKLTGAGSVAGIGASALALQSFAPAAPKSTDTRFNVKKFGAKGDGVASDSAAIQRAIDAAGEVQGTVWFPAGRYLCHGLKVPAHVTLLADPVWIFHNEKVGAVLELDDPSADCLLDITGAYGVHVHGLVLCGIPDQGSAHGIYLNNPDKWSPKEDTLVLDDVKVMLFAGHGVYLKRVWLFIIRHSQFMSNGGDGVRLLGWDGFVTDNQFSANGGSGFFCETKGTAVMFTANRVEWNQGYGLYITGGNDWNVTGNSFDRNWGAGLCVENAEALAVTGNVFRRCGKDSDKLAEGEHSCQVRLCDVRGLSLTGNTCLAGQDDSGKGKFTPQIGFIIKNLSSCVISGNTLWHGYMDRQLLDGGGHVDLVLKDNPGCAAGK